MRTPALINITIPGTEILLAESFLIKNVKELLLKNNIQSSVVDTVSGWGCLNQDWLEFVTEINTSYDWVKFPEITEDIENFSVQEFNNCFPTGRLLMGVRWIVTDESGNKKYIQNA